MSFNFSVKEATPEAAVKAFIEECKKNEKHIPNAVSHAMYGAADRLLYNAKSNQVCAISCAGHINADETGTAEVRVIISNPEPEAPAVPVGTYPDTNEA